MKYLILRSSAKFTMAHLSKFKNQILFWVTQQWVSLKKHANSLLLTLWICKPSLANNVELRQIVNHENDSILFPTLWVYQNTNSSDQTMLQFSQGYCCNGLCICHLRQIRSYLPSKHFFNAFQRRLWNL